MHKSDLHTLQERTARSSRQTRLGMPQGQTILATDCLSGRRDLICSKPHKRDRGGNGGWKLGPERGCETQRSPLCPSSSSQICGATPSNQQSVLELALTHGMSVARHPDNVNEHRKSAFAHRSSASQKRECSSSVHFSLTLLETYGLRGAGASILPGRCN